MDSHHIDNTPLLLSREDEAALLTEQALAHIREVSAADGVGGDDRDPEKAPFAAGADAEEELNNFDKQDGSERWQEQRCWSRCCGSRRRCCCTVCLVLFVGWLVATLVILCAVVPGVIQKSLDSSSFRFTSIINMTQPTNDSFVLSAHAEVTASSPVPATLVNGPSDGLANFFYDRRRGEWRRFGTMRLPDMPLDAGDDVVGKVTFNEVVHVTDFAAWNDFNAACMLQDTFELRFESKTTALHVRGTWSLWGLLVYRGLTLRKEITLNGAGGFPGLRVKSCTVPPHTQPLRNYAYTQPLRN